MDWISSTDVAARLGVDPSALTEQAARAACQLVRDRRSLTADDQLATSPAVTEGTLRWASLLVQATNSPNGFAGWDAVNPGGGYGDNMSDIYRLVGSDPVIA